MLNAIFLRVIAAIVSLSCILFFAPGKGVTEPYDVKDPDSIVTTLTVFSDVHVEGNNYPRYKVFADCMRNAKQNRTPSDAILFLGDNTMNGQHIENLMLHGTLAHILRGENIITIPGNHDVGNGEGDFHKLQERWYRYTNAFFGRRLVKPYFCEIVNGSYVIVLSNEDEDVGSLHMSEEQFAWLEETLAEAAGSGMPVFVLAHYHPRMAIPIKQDSEYSLIRILAEYNREHDLFYLCGHLHMTPGVNSFHSWSGFPEAYLPCLTLLDENGEIFDQTGFGEMVEVYPDRVVFRMRNFYTGEWAQLNGAPHEATYMLKEPITGR